MNPTGGPRARRWGAAAVLGGILGSVSCFGSGGQAREALRFWALGREGEVVAELVRDFEIEHPGIRVELQQIPWSAAHEKLLTAYMGRSTPDLAQIGNTWVPEFRALGAIEPLGPRILDSATIDAQAYFPGIWETNVLDGEAFGIPWYVDTRVLFYRKDLLAAAGYDTMPATWEGWRRALEAVKSELGPDRYPVFLPVNEWTQPVIFGLQAGSPLLADDDTRGCFSEEPFRSAFEFYLDLYRSGLAPALGNNEIANAYQEFARGTFAMWITGPWNLGEFRRRLPPELQDAWGTAPLPGPTGPGVSLAGGSSLVLFRNARNPDAAWRLIEYLSRPEIQARFYRLSGDLPSRVEAWEDPGIASDRELVAFRDQLRRSVPTPKVPEWEQIAIRVQERADYSIRGGVPADSTLARLDRDAWSILEKRRWLLSEAGASGRAEQP